MTHEEMRAITMEWAAREAELCDLAAESTVKPKDLVYTRKTPCDDCPFRVSVPPEDGIGGNIPSVAFSMERGLFGHTCHKTDPRAYGYVPGYTGPVEHCVGAIVMLEKTNKKVLRAQEHLRAALASGKLDLGRYDLSDPDVLSWKQFITKYVEYFTERVRDYKKRRRRAPVTEGTYL